MDNFSLSAADICRIIKQCNQFNVKMFDFNGLHLKFHSRRNENVELGQASVPTFTDYPISPDEHQQRDQAELMDQTTLLEAEEAQLLIDDPAGYERSQIDRHIERGRLNETHQN